MQVSTAILAGGRSRRMGREKALLKLGSSTLIERVIAAAAPLTADWMLIAPRKRTFSHLELPILPDLRPGLGPLGGLHTALKRAACPLLLLLACDLPFLTTDFLRFMLAQLGHHQALVPRSPTGLQPLCALYTRACLPAVEAAIQGDQLHVPSFYDEVDLRLLEPSEWQAFDVHDLLFTNLNTPAEYQRAGRLVERRPDLFEEVSRRPSQGR